MQVPLSKVYFPAAKRLRQDYGDTKELGKSLAEYGQLYPIIVRKLDRSEFPDAPDEAEWVIVDGGRRYYLITYLNREEVDIAVPGLEKGMIAVTEHDFDDWLRALEIEFHTNEDRKAFEWKEKAEYVLRIHKAHSEMNEEWSVKHTAVLLDMSEVSVYQYLQIVKDPDIFKHEKVQSATSFRTAYKQASIAREHKERKQKVKEAQKAREAQEEEASENGESTPTDPHALALRILDHEPLEDWLPKIESESLDWFHWDPPYGSGQMGGNRAYDPGQVDDWGYAYQLLRFAVPEIYRTLKDGRWLAIWCHPERVEWLKRFLQGHRIDDERYRCIYCEKPWGELHTSNNCSAGEWAFWVNQYPNIWYKPNRVSDGHEIKRYQVNAYETFLYAAKVELQTDPILINNSRQNVYMFDMETKGDRTHIWQKPVPVLKAIIESISVAGERGADCSVGSGTILEACFDSGRIMTGCEKDESCWLDALNRIEAYLETRLRLPKG